MNDNWTVDAEVWAIRHQVLVSYNCIDLFEDENWIESVDAKATTKENEQ